MAAVESDCSQCNLSDSTLDRLQTCRDCLNDCAGANHIDCDVKCNFGDDFIRVGLIADLQ